MKRPLPFWLAAVVPATLVAHGLAYALGGQAASDAHHAYIAPALECSLAVLAAVALALIGGALVRASVLVHTAAERSVPELWPRLALAQLALFAAMEWAEGTHAGLFGSLVQVVVALAAAYLLSLFSRLLVQCVTHAHNISRYLGRSAHRPAFSLVRAPHCFAYALAVRAGTARFQRPPPTR